MHNYKINHPLQKAYKTFFLIARLNRLSVHTNVDPTLRFWHYRYTFFVAPCNELPKYFYTDAHLQYMWKNAVVVLFFHLIYKWLKWCAQTLHPFSQTVR